MKRDFRSSAGTSILCFQSMTALILLFSFPVFHELSTVSTGITSEQVLSHKTDTPKCTTSTGDGGCLQMNPYAVLIPMKQPNQELDSVVLSLLCAASILGRNADSEMRMASSVLMVLDPWLGQVLR